MKDTDHHEGNRDTDTSQDEKLAVFDPLRCIIPNRIMYRNKRHHAYSPATRNSIEKFEADDQCYLLVVHLFLVSPRGNLLMQQRAQDIDYGGMWDCGVTGHVQKGETSKQAVKRELREELGIDDTVLLSQIDKETPLQLTFGKYHIDVYVVIWKGVEKYVQEHEHLAFSTLICGDVECVRMLDWRDYLNKINEKSPGYFYADLKESGYHLVFKEIENRLTLGVEPNKSCSSSILINTGT